MEDWNLTSCLRVFRRNKRALLFITFGAGIGVLIVACMQPRLYQARAAIEVQYPNERFLDLVSVYPSIRTDADLSVQTQLELLRQDSLLSKAARKLHLAATAESAYNLVSKLRQEISIVPLHNTRIIEIVCDAPQPSSAADLANALAEALIEQDIQSEGGEARRLTQSLQNQLAMLQPKEDARGPRSLANEALSGAVLQDANQARLASATYQSNVRLLAAAEPPAWAHKPNIPLAVAIGLVGGFIAGAGLVMLREQNSELLRSPGDVARRLGLAELGAVPKVSAAESLLADEPHSAIAEALYPALAAILANDHCAPRTIAVTSSFSGEGKTTILCHLGVAIASIGRKTLLIDANMGSPRLQRVFSVPNLYGLSDLLIDGSKIDRAALDRAISKTSIPHLYTLTAGTQTEQAFRLFKSGAIEALLGMLQQQFEFILVDAPACLDHAETLTLVQNADAIVLVVAANCTHASAVRKAAELLQRARSCTIGVVLNRYGSTQV